MKRELINENTFYSLLYYLTQNLTYRNTIDENIKKIIKAQLKDTKLIDNILNILNENIDNKKTIIIFIFYLMILLQISSNNEKSIKIIINLFQLLLIIFHKY